MFPSINIKGTNTDVAPEWKALVNEKLAHLGKYIGAETDVKCDVEFEKVANHHSGPVHRVEANLWLSGTMHRAEATEDNFEKAIDAVRNQLDGELRRAHDKQTTLFRRGKRIIKRMINRN